MSKRSQEKRRARSKEKKRARMRMQGSSPLSRLAGTAEETCECWMLCSEDERMISLQVMRPVRGGQTAAACFLVDRDCIGLKDAFYRLDVDPLAIREALRERSRAEGVRVLGIDLAQARQLVAGAIRWTRAHPFRIPPDTERCVKILGGMGDVDAASVADFGDDGKLVYVGRQVDLVKCLQGITLEEFLAREDVEVVFHLGNETFGDDYAEEWDEADDEFDGMVDADVPLMESEEVDAEAEEEELREMRQELKRKMLDAVRRWCFSNARMPHPELEAAVDLTIDGATEGLAEDEEEAATRRGLAAQRTLLSFETPEKQAALEAAMAQLEEFANSFPSRREFMRATGAKYPDAW